jgi:hypothetical protein
MDVMKTLRAVLVGTLGVGLAVPAWAEKTPACIRSWGQVVSTLAGYNHIVGIDNGCDRPASCVVSTDLAPDPIQASVPARQKVELVTFRGSPASTFKPKVSCTLQ